MLRAFFYLSTERAQQRSRPLHLTGPHRGPDQEPKIIKQPNKYASGTFLEESSIQTTTVFVRFQATWNLDKSLPVEAGAHSFRHQALWHNFGSRLRTKSCPSWKQLTHRSLALRGEGSGGTLTASQDIISLLREFLPHFSGLLAA